MYNRKKIEEIGLLRLYVAAPLPSNFSCSIDKNYNRKPTSVISIFALYKTGMIRQAEGDKIASIKNIRAKSHVLENEPET